VSFKSGFESKERKSQFKRAGDLEELFNGFSIRWPTIDIVCV